MPTRRKLSADRPLPATGRHREVLSAALRLIAEHGYAGASLRELARRVGMSQPSLYHYFASKQDLVLQILETYSAVMMQVPPIPDDLAALPRIIAGAVRALYAGPDHPLFARVMFATSRLDPRFGARCREIFVDRVQLGIRALVAPYVARGEIAEADAIDLVRMVVYAIGFRFMEERVLFDDRPLGRPGHHDHHRRPAGRDPLGRGRRGYLDLLRLRGGVTPTGGRRGAGWQAEVLVRVSASPPRPA